MCHSWGARETVHGCPPQVSIRWTAGVLGTVGGGRRALGTDAAGGGWPAGLGREAQVREGLGTRTVGPEWGEEGGFRKLYGRSGGEL